MQSFREVNSKLQQVQYVAFTQPAMPYAEVPYQGFWSDVPSQNMLKVFVGLSAPPVPALTLVPPADTETDAPKRKITVFAMDPLTGASLKGSVCINGYCGTTGVEISYPGCVSVDPRTHQRQFISCKGGVTVPNYPVAKFTD